MRSVFHQPSSDRPEALLRRRTTVLALVVAAHALLMVMLLRLAPPPPPSSPVVTTVELIPEPQKRESAVAEPTRATKTAPRRPPAPPPVEVTPYKLDIIELTPEQFAASNIARIPSQRSGAPTADAAQETASADAAGRGPNGERLYDADWYRKPTQAELSYYLPRGAARPIGWGIIACQTVADYRVDNCVELGESPGGSGLATAVLNAAWQFRVWPPRLGGRPLVGAWVRIRIEFSEDEGGG